MAAGRVMMAAGFFCGHQTDLRLSKSIKRQYLWALLWKRSFEDSPVAIFFFLPSRRPFPPFSLSVLPRLFTKAIAHIYEINPHRNIQRAFFFFIRHTRARSFIPSLLAHHIHPPFFFYYIIIFFLSSFFTGRCSIDIPFGANLVGRW